MFSKVNKLNDQQLRNLLNSLIEGISKKQNLTRDDSILFIKGMAIKSLPFARKQKIINTIDSLLVSK